MNEWEQCISEWADRNMKLQQQQLADAQAQIEALQKENRELNLTLSRCEKVFDRAKVEYQGDTELSLRQFFVKYQSLEKQVEALQRERNELREMTKIICGHCCEPMAIPSKAILQSQLSQLQALVRALVCTMGYVVDGSYILTRGGVVLYACSSAISAERLGALLAYRATLPATPTEEAT